ncbi:hypothetical protein [uncultured Alistipes sp.]|uniref:hypothetical protein n=1 Tax=uncultured Alistipes sp. TaxID=538949 RepID=UPI0025EB1918|nr:hypothetical protein [uncultured Alistipes sp.]
MKNNRFSPQETARRKRAEEKTAQEMSRNRLIQLFCLLFFLKFLLFDLLWCLDTTFSSFSYPIAYLSKSILALLLTLPLVLRAPRWVEAVVALATDLFLVANLLYFRTYYTAIPLESYALAGNLRDFTASVTESLRWPDLLFPLSTAAALLAARRMPQPRLPRRGLVRYANALLLSSLLTAALLVGKGGLPPQLRGDARPPAAERDDHLLALRHAALRGAARAGGVHPRAGRGGRTLARRRAPGSRC